MLPRNLDNVELAYYLDAIKKGLLARGVDATLTDTVMTVFTALLQTMQDLEETESIPAKLIKAVQADKDSMTPGILTSVYAIALLKALAAKNLNTVAATIIINNAAALLN